MSARLHPGRAWRWAAFALCGRSSIAVLVAFHGVPPALADVAFCVGNESNGLIAAQTLSELGVVVTEVPEVSSPVGGPAPVRANNYVGKGAGQEWTTPITGIAALPGGKCYNVSMMSKFSAPNGQAEPWNCLMVYGSNLPDEVVIQGSLVTATDVIDQGKFNLVAQPTAFSSTAPTVNCAGSQ